MKIVLKLALLLLPIVSAVEEVKEKVVAEQRKKT